MSNIRRPFFETISIMRDVASNALLTDNGPGPSDHNTRARILRSGLVVASFALLEAYIEDRLEEKIPDLARSQMGYASFGDALRGFLVVDAINGLSKRLSFSDKNSKLQFALQHLPRVAGVSATPPTYTGLGFYPDGSNIKDQDIAELLKTFAINRPWQQMSSLCTTVGATRASLIDDYKKFLIDRNRCAHESTANVPTADLVAHFQTAALVAIVIDVLLSSAIDCLATAASFSSAETAIANVSPTFVFLDKTGTRWAERKSGARRATRIHTDFAAALAAAKGRPGVDFIIVRDQQMIPIELVA